MICYSVKNTKQKLELVSRTHLNCQLQVYILSILLYQNISVICQSEIVSQLCLTLCDPMDCSPSGSSCPWNSPGKNNGMSCHSLLQRIFLTQGLNLGFLHLQADSLQSEPLGKPISGCGGLVAKSCGTVATPWTVALQAPLSMVFSRQEYWN